MQKTNVFIFTHEQFGQICQPNKCEEMSVQIVNWDWDICTIVLPTLDFLHIPPPIMIKN